MCHSVNCIILIFNDISLIIIIDTNFSFVGAVFNFKLKIFKMFSFIPHNTSKPCNYLLNDPTVGRLRYHLINLYATGE